MEAYRAAADAFLAAGGDPEAAARDVPLIVSAVARDHPDWLYRPVRERIAREERWWKAQGVWPPPKDRREWPAEFSPCRRGSVACVRCVLQKRPGRVAGLGPAESADAARGARITYIPGRASGQCPVSLKALNGHQYCGEAETAELSQLAVVAAGGLEPPTPAL